jgi:hypothetical protein
MRDIKEIRAELKRLDNERWELTRQIVAAEPCRKQPKSYECGDVQYWPASKGDPIKKAEATEKLGRVYARMEEVNAELKAYNGQKAADKRAAKKAEEVAA